MIIIHEQFILGTLLRRVYEYMYIIKNYLGLVKIIDALKLKLKIMNYY